MDNSPNTSVIKGILSLSLMVIALAIGFCKFPLWSVLLVAIPFTAAYIQGKWYLWGDIFRQRTAKLYSLLLTTYGIQVVVVGVFYLIGSGIARVFQR
jgi:hypothetical protein